MKKLITLLFATTIFNYSFAQNNNKKLNIDFMQKVAHNRNYNTTTLQVIAFTQNKYVVIVDNYTEYESKNYNGTTVIAVGELPAGSHNIGIYEIKKGFFGTQKKQIYNGIIYLKAANETTINIDYNDQISIMEKTIYSNGGNNGNGCGNGNGRKNKYKKHRHYNDDKNNFPTYNQQVSDNDFNQLKQYIKKEAFDDRKVALAKQGAGNNYFSTSQVSQLMSLISFDNGKLDIAKYFYNQCIDKNNYYQLADALSFSSSKDELLNYIKK